MDLQKYVNELKGIRGYLAAGVMHYTGDLLVGDASGGIDLGLVSATFNDIFRQAHDVCLKIGLEAMRELVLYTPKGIVVMLCTGGSDNAHVHMITILSNDGNQALAKMTMERLAPLIVKDLT